MSKNDILSPVPADFKWPQCPEAEQFIQQSLVSFLEKHSFAKKLSERMKKETSTDFQVWVEYLVLPENKISLKKLNDTYGFVRDEKSVCEKGESVFWHPFADLPRILFSSKIKSISCAIHVDSLEDFQTSHNLKIEIEGSRFSHFRRFFNFRK